VAQLVALVPAAGALPWGRVAYGTSTSNTGPISADTDIVSATFTAVAGRRYKVSGCVLYVTAGAINAVFAKITDGANAQIQVVNQGAPAAIFGLLTITVEIPPGAAGSRTYKLRAATNQSTINLNGGVGQTHWIMVEDVGI